MSFQKAFLGFFVAVTTFSSMGYGADFWTCKYKGGSGSYYYSTDQVREVALNRAYSQCYSSKDTPCASAGCEKSLVSATPSKADAKVCK